MDDQPPDQFGGKREGVMASVRSRRRELAERSSNGMHVRLLWRQGTRQLWVEVRGPDDRVLAIPVEPERALDAFHHPYAYAGSHSLLLPVRSLAPRERRPQAADKEHRGH
jgi:hypothetical protein